MPTLSLKDILGTTATLRSEDDPGEYWIKNHFTEFVDKVTPGPEPVVFLDLVITLAATNAIFSGLATRSPNARDTYQSKVLQEMVDRRDVCVGTHPEFQSGMFNKAEPTTASWLYEICAPNSLPEDDPTNIILSDKHAVDVIDRFFSGSRQSLLTWQRQAEKANLHKSWEEYGKLVAAWHQGKKSLHLAGIPILIPTRSLQGAVEASIGSLFLGIESDNTDTAKIRIGELARYTYIFALRNFSVSNEHLEHLAKYRSQLLSLQRPLNILSKAFRQLQSEAQEMQAILNDPQDSLFASHSIVAHLFQEGVRISIGNYLSFIPAHNYIDELDPRTSRLAYCYALSCILGFREMLSPAQNTDSVGELTRLAIREIRSRGVLGDLIQILEVILSNKAHSLHNSIEGSIPIDDKSDICEIERKLRVLKAIIFSPFKDFSGEWFNAPVFLAASQPEKLRDRMERVPLVGDSFLFNEDFRKPAHLLISPSRTPFAQHAILEFILNVRRSLADAGGPRDMPIGVLMGAEQKLNGYLLNLRKSRFFNEKKDPNYLSNGGNLLGCIESVMRFGAAGRNFGNFLGAFQGLLRHSNASASRQHAQKGDWISFTREKIDKAVKGGKTSRPLLVLGRLSERPAPDGQLSERVFDAYFGVIQWEVGDSASPDYYLHIIWTDKANDLLNAPDELLDFDRHSELFGYPASKNSEPIKSESVKHQTLPLTTAQTERIALVDYADNKTWYETINANEDLLTRVTLIPIDYYTPHAFNDFDRTVAIFHFPSGDENGTLLKEWTRVFASHKSLQKLVVVSAGGQASSKLIAWTRIPEYKEIKVAVTPVDITPNLLKYPKKRQTFLKFLID